MGSSRRRHSTGRKAGAFRARKGKCKTSRPSPVAPPKPDFHAILGRLSDSLSMIATAARSMAAIEEREGSLHEPDVNMGEELITLEHGVLAFRAAYSEIDVALRTVTP
jgi:hypothetical protein